MDLLLTHGGCLTGPGNQTEEATVRSSDRRVYLPAPGERGTLEKAEEATHLWRQDERPDGAGQSWGARAPVGPPKTGS